MAETKLRQALRFRGMTALWLAHKVGASSTAIGRYVSGERTPRVDLAQRIADELGLGVNDVFPPEVMK